MVLEVLRPGSPHPSGRLFVCRPLLGARCRPVYGWYCGDPYAMIIGPPHFCRRSGNSIKRATGLPAYAQERRKHESDRK
jgi:hypothetical protein